MEGAAFCPVCGTPTQRVAPPSPTAQPVYPPYGGYAQGNSQGYGQGYGQPPAAAPYAPAPANAVRKQSGQMSKGGFITLIILSASAMGMYMMYLITSLTEYRYSDTLSMIIVICDLLLCMVPLFILCLMARKLPGVLFAIPLLIEATLMIMNLIAYANYYFAWVIIADLMLVSGAVMYLVTMLIKSRPLVMRIITAALIGTYTIEIFYYLYNSVAYGFSRSLFANLGLICFYAAAILYLFVSKPSKA